MKPTESPLRIGILSTCLFEFGSGAERVATTIAERLSNRHEIFLLGYRDDHAIITDAQGRPLGSRSLPRRSRLSGRFGNRATKSLWHLQDNYRATTANELASIARAFRLDVISSHTISGASSALWGALLGVNVPTVHTLHDYYLTCVRGSYFKHGNSCNRSCVSCLPRQMTSRVTARTCSQFVSPSRDCAVEHEKVLGLPPGSVAIIRNAASGTVSSQPKAEHPVTVLFVGKLEPHKGVLVLLQALRLQAGLPINVAFAGDGSLLSFLHNEAESEPRLRVFGRLDHDGLSQLYRRSSVLAVPSLWPENAPMVAYEALAAGLPVAVSPVGGLPELAEESGACLIAEGHTAADWAKMLRRVASLDGYAIRRLSDLAVDFSSRHDATAMVGAYDKAFRRVVESHRGSSVAS